MPIKNINTDKTKTKKTNDERINNGLQNTTQKTKDRASPTPPKTGSELPKTF
jgi:hypothetical protein